MLIRWDAAAEASPVWVVSAEAIWAWRRRAGQSRARAFWYTIRMRALAALISFGRLCFGIAFIAEPKLMDRGWIGKQARVPGAQVLARAVGARDLAVGLGGLQATARNDGSARPWLAAASLCDAVDFGATWAAGRRIPRQARNGVLAIAGVFSVLSAIAAAGSGAPDLVEPASTGLDDLSQARAVPSEPVGTRE
jgi:hypothetical protein